MQAIGENSIVRGMIRVEAGEDLVSALESLAFVAEWREALVTGTGSLDLLELEVGTEIVSLERAEVLSFNGHIVRGDARTVARINVQVLAGGRVYAGRIVQALTGPGLLAVEAVLATAVRVPVVAKAAPPAAVEPVRARKPEVAVSVARPSSPGFAGALSFGQVPVVVPRGRVDPSLDRAEDEYWIEVAAGDWLDHPQLGRGEVVGDDESGGMRVRIQSGRVCVLRLDTLEVAAPVQESDGRRVFRVLGPKRRR